MNKFSFKLLVVVLSPVMLVALLWHIIIEVYLFGSIYCCVTGKNPLQLTYIKRFGLSGLITRNIRKLEIMDIGGNSKGYPNKALSNFTPRHFIFKGVECASIEGVLQSFKFKELEMQKFVCSLVGRAAKYKGKNKKWWRTQTLYWQGVEYKRNSPEYQELLNELYHAVYIQCESFRKALKATNGATLKHSIGKSDRRTTVLTEREFCSRLEYYRDLLNN